MAKQNNLRPTARQTLSNDSLFLCKELIQGYLDDITGVYQTPQGYYKDDANVEAFDRDFPPKEKLKLQGQIFD